MEKLAIDGGPPAVSALTGVSRPKIGVEEFYALAESFGFTDEALARVRAAVGEGDFAATGPSLVKFRQGSRGEAFEALARSTFDVAYARGVSSGTAALHCAMVAIGAGPGTEVIVPAIGFMATAAAVLLAGGTPVFADVDESLHLDAAAVEARITERTIGIAPTHVMGGVCDMGPILEVARRHNLRVVEDCAQAPGARYRGRHVGTLGDIGCFSISCYKIIGGGEGGLVITNDERLFERASQISEGGGLWRPQRFAPPRYEDELLLGTNYRMSELEAIVDVVQLGKLEAVAGRFRAVKQRVLRQLKTFREIVPQRLNDPEGEVGGGLRFFPESLELGRRIAEALRAEGIPAGWRGPSSGPDWHVYSQMLPLALLPNGDAFRCRPGDCPVADDLWAREVTLGLGQWLSIEDCDAIAHGINKVLSAYCTPDDAARPWL